MARRLQSKSFLAGDVLCTEGDPAEGSKCFFVIQEGVVVVSSTRAEVTWCHGDATELLACACVGVPLSGDGFFVHLHIAS